MLAPWHEPAEVSYTARTRLDGSTRGLCVRIPAKQLRSLVHWAWRDVTVLVAVSNGTSASYREGSYTGRIRVNTQGKGCVAIPKRVVETLAIQPRQEIRVQLVPVVLAPEA